MYTRCLTCRHNLGRNEVIEPFPVGKRIAFDPEKGRLWALCSRCRSWSLAPLDERWEAIESAERAFEQSAVGASTPNVTLARATDGTRLLRVGKVQRQELAAWRYGKRLKSRGHKFTLRNMAWGVGGGVVISGGAAALPAIAALPAVLIGAAAPIAFMALQEMMNSSDRVPSLSIQGERVSGWNLHQARFLATSEVAPGWRLEIPQGRNASTLTVEGADALSILRRILPGMSPWGGTGRQVDNAVKEVVRLGSAKQVLLAAAEDLAGDESYQPFGRPMRTWFGPPPRHLVAGAHPVLRLSMEMAVNEEVERRALEGELALLEREWRDAEEAAAISDSLLVPEGFRVRLKELRSGKRI